MPEALRRPHDTSADPVREHYDTHGFYFTDEGPARDAFARHSQLGKLLQRPDVNRLGPTVDIGCGEGRVYLLMDDAQRSRYVGIDVSSGMLRRVRERAKGARLVQADACGLPIQTGSAGLVVCQGVLHHTRDPREAFAELARIIAPGGWLQISVYNRRALYYYLFAALNPLCKRLAAGNVGRRLLAVTVFPVVYALIFQPAHFAYGVYRPMPVRGAWKFFLDQYAHPRVRFFRRREICDWAEEEGLELVRFDHELVGWMLSYVLRKREG
jgi:SAM-dependent methyltransferase